MALVESLKGKETSVYQHVTGRLVNQSDLEIMQEAAAHTGFNLRLLAKPGEQYTQIRTSEKIVGKIAEGERYSVKPHTAVLLVVPDGQAYVSLTRYSLRAHDFSLVQFDREVKILKQSARIA